MHMNRNSCLLNFRTIALCFFFQYLNFFRCISLRLSKLWLWSFVGDRSHQGRVQCTRTITLACLTFELLPFVYFHIWFLSGAYLENYTSYGYEILWVDRSYQGGVQCTWTVTLACLIFKLLPFVYFHTCFLSGAHLQDYAIYSYDISWVDRSHQGGVQCKKNHNSPLLNFWVIALCLFSYLIFVQSISQKLE